MTDVAEKMLLEVRLYRIKPGKRTDFDALARHETIPMARRFGHNVVGFGPSAHDDDSYYLIRAFTDEQDRKGSLEALYESEEWLTGYDQRVLSLIDSYLTATFQVSAEAVATLISDGAHF